MKFLSIIAIVFVVGKVLHYLVKRDRVLTSLEKHLSKEQIQFILDQEGQIYGQQDTV